jgi:hypothetical protein
MMSGVYGVLMWSSETDNTGKAWMAIGLAMVLVVWWLFRTLTGIAALSRAVSVGDAKRTLELVGDELPRRKQPAGRAPLLVSRAFAHELRGEWSAVLATLEEAQLAAIPARQRTGWTALAAAARIGALIEMGDVARARRVLDTELVPLATGLDRRRHPMVHLHLTLAKGRVAAAEGNAAEAKPLLQAALDDIHAAAAVRALAHFTLARITAEPEASKHRAEIVKLIPDETLFVRKNR